MTVRTAPLALLDDLNEQQRAVVTAPTGPVLVVAGAGSGKTTTLVRRVAWLVAQGVPPSSILLLTFTRSAAASMLARARGLVPEARAVTGGTFHSVAASVVREHHEVFGLPETLAVLDPDDVEQAIKSALVEVPFPGRGRTPRASSVAGVLSYRTNTRSTIDAAVARRAVDWAGFASWFDAVGERYATWKLERGLLDYDDLLLLLSAALADPRVGAHLRARWPIVLVDEHQDSNALQLEIVYGLGGERGDLMVVGDPAQAIYGFRGSAPATLFHFRERYPAARVLALEVNYRSTQPILDLVNAVDRAMWPRFDRELRAAPASGELPATRPELVLSPDERTQAEDVVERVLTARDAGVELAEQAVLVRSMWAARRIEAELLARRVPYRVVGGLRIDEAAHVKDLLSLARVVDNPQHEPAWGRVLGRLPGVGPASVRALLGAILPASGSATERLAGLAWPRRVEPAPLRAALAELSGEGAPGERLRGAIRAFEPIFRHTYDAEWRDRRRDLDTVATLADDHATLTDFLTAITLDYRLDTRDRLDPTARPDERPLTVSTIHSAKGLEWHTVHVAGFVSGHIPSPWAEELEDQAEELRVFYVAASRARRRLLLYRPAVGEQGQLREPSIYEPLVEPFVDRVAPPPEPVPEPAPTLTGVRLDLRSILLGKKTP